MLQKNDLEKLKKYMSQGYDDINILLKSADLDPARDFVGFDFSNMFLPHLNLSGYNIEGANFSNSILPFSNFTNSNIEDAVFNNANLQFSDFRESLGFDSNNCADAFLQRAYLPSDVSIETPNTKRKIGAILFIEDEIQSIKQSMEVIHDLFPMISIDVASSKFDGKKFLESKEYWFSIIDAKIPNSNEEEAKELLGVELSEMISSGLVSNRNADMPHIMLTEHKAAISGTKNIFERGKCLGIVEKGNNYLQFEKLVINNLFGSYISKVRTVTI